MFYNDDLKNCHIISKPKKYQTQRDDLRQAFKDLTPLERIVYASYQITTLREIAATFKKHHEHIRRVYIRACKKIDKAKNPPKCAKST
jgi:hypothetical protein